MDISLPFRRVRLGLLALVAAATPLICPAAEKGPEKGAASTAAIRPAKKAAAGKAAADAKKYLLQYRFRAGETLRWEVEQRGQIRTTIQGTTQTAETVTTSVKVWKVNSVDALGRAKFTYSVESVDMRQKFDGRQASHYNSETDTEVPPGFGDVAKAVGVPLAIVTLDAQGKTVRREELREQPGPAPELITPLLPAGPVALGDEWTSPADIQVTLKTQEVKKIKARQQYTLKSVDGDVATVALETQILSPIRDNPEIEAQIAQSKGAGEFRFSIEDGRILSQQTDVDERVNGFQGEASSLHCITRFTEKLLPAVARTAARPPVAGPPAGPLARPASSSAPLVRPRDKRENVLRR
jgi:hypothetical protein